MPDYPNDPNLTSKMFHAIFNGMQEVAIASQIGERRITITEVFLEYGDNFQKCSNILRNHFWKWATQLLEELQLSKDEFKRGEQLTILWSKVCRLIFEGAVPYNALQQSCDQITRISEELEPNHKLIIKQESMCALIQIWLDYNKRNLNR